MFDRYPEVTHAKTAADWGNPQNLLLLVGAVFLGGFAVAGGAASGGPVQPLEQTSLAEMASPDRRTDLYAVYGIVGMGGVSLGALAAGLPALYQDLFGLTELFAFKLVFVTFAFLLAVAVRGIHTTCSVR